MLSPTSVNEAKCIIPSKPVCSVKQPRDRINIAQIAFDKGRIGMDGLAMALVQVVEHHHLVAGLEQLGGGDAADVAGAAGDEDFQDRLSLVVLGLRMCGRSRSSI